MQAALIIALKAFLFLHRWQYTIFLSAICSLPVLGGLCVHRKSDLFVTKKSLFFNKLLEKVINLLIFDDFDQQTQIELSLYIFF